MITGVGPVWAGLASPVSSSTSWWDLTQLGYTNSRTAWQPWSHGIERDHLARRPRRPEHDVEVEIPMIAWTVIGAGLLAILVAGQVTGASRRRLSLGNDPLDRQMAILASPRWVIPLNLGGWLVLAIGGGWLAWTLLS
jgi:hypothetical protein